MQRVHGPVPVFEDIEYEIDDQQRIDRPLDGLLELVHVGCGDDLRIIRIHVTSATPRLYAYMFRRFESRSLDKLVCKIALC